MEVRTKVTLRASCLFAKDPCKVLMVRNDPCPNLIAIADAVA